MTWHRPGVRPHVRPERDDNARAFLRDLRLVAGIARASGVTPVEAQRVWLLDAPERLQRLCTIATCSTDDRPRTRALELLERLLEDVR